MGLAVEVINEEEERTTFVEQAAETIKVEPMPVINLETEHELIEEPALEQVEEEATEVDKLETTPVAELEAEPEAIEELTQKEEEEENA